VSKSLVSASVPPAYQNASATEILISRCLCGEEEAYVEVYNHYAGPIYRLCYSLLQHREDAEEVMQDSFEYAFRRINHYDASRSAFNTWLFQIAISRCRNKRRRKWLPTIPFGQLFGDRLMDNNVIHPDEKLHLDERQKKVWSALGQLSPKLRETAVLRYYEGLTYTEIGQIMAIPPKTAESRMRLAHKALAKLSEGDFGQSERGGLDVT
jgi:RNA polymerase sigma-70 factor (ECF subfamily)